VEPKKKPQTKKPDHSKPYMYAGYSDQQAAAIQALTEGRANEGQQKIALDWIINDVCRYYDLSYRPGPEGDRDTAFAEGKRFVGSNIVKMTRLKISQLGGTNNEI